MPRDSNGVRDVFVHDRHERTTKRISVGARGGPANGASDIPRISADGRFVVFASDATNLVPRDTNRVRDVFLYDRARGTLERVSAPIGEQADGPSDYPQISGDGSRVAFVSRATNLADEETAYQQVFLHDLRENRVSIVSALPGGDAGDDDSGDWGLAISADGRCVAFTSFASNLGAVRSPSLFVAVFSASGSAWAD